MNSTISYLILISSFIFNNSPTTTSVTSFPIDLEKELIEDSTSMESPCIEEAYGLKESSCATAFGGTVTTYNLQDGYKNVGQSVWISRKGGKAKAIMCTIDILHGE